jgi:segregation and condensation protein A
MINDEMNATPAVPIQEAPEEGQGDGESGEAERENPDLESEDTEAQVVFPGFTGSWEGLARAALYKKINILDIPLAELVRNFSKRVDDKTDSEKVSFLSAASRLLQMKAEAILQADDAGTVEVETPPEPPEPETQGLDKQRQFFQRALQAIKAAAETEISYTPIAEIVQAPPLERLEVDLKRLTNAFQKAVEKLKEKQSAGPTLVFDRIDVDQEVQGFRKLREKGSSFLLGPIFAACATRFQLIGKFLALLEMLKAGEILASQPEPFGEVEIQFEG